MGNGYALNFKKDFPKKYRGFISLFPNIKLISPNKGKVR